MYCKKCGERLAPGSNFCSRCGTNQTQYRGPIYAPPPPPPPPPPPRHMPPPPPPRYAPPPPPPPMRQKLLRITRENKFMGSTILADIYVDGRPVGQVANGKIVEILIPGNAGHIQAIMPARPDISWREVQSNILTIPPGPQDVNCNLAVNSSLLKPTTLDFFLR